MGLYRSLAGLVTVEVTSADPQQSLSRIIGSGIPIYDATFDGALTVRFTIYRADQKRIVADAEKHGERVRIVRHKGIYWSLRNLLNRPVLLIGVALLFFLVVYLPSRVLFIEVEGNVSVPARQIIEAAQESGICFGASRREVRSEKMKNALLSYMPQLQWAGVNTYGCTAVISVRERSAPEEQETKNEVSSIAAVRDGVVTSVTVTRGNGLCTVGQAVQKGQILISGYTDCGICITATRAQGEIIAQTSRDLTVKMPSEQAVRLNLGDEQVRFSLIIGKKRINFFKGSGISDTSCVKMYSKYVLTLPGGFTLPVVFVKETTQSSDFAAAEFPRSDAEAVLTEFAARYLGSQMVAGRIVNRDETVSAQPGAYTLSGVYACTEMIGREQSEEIGEYNGKTD